MQFLTKLRNFLEYAELAYGLAIKPIRRWNRWFTQLARFVFDSSTGLPQTGIRNAKSWFVLLRTEQDVRP